MSQERYCSSTEFELGLNAYLVAKRCTVLRSQAEQEFIFWLQAMSFQRGGLKALCEDLAAQAWPSLKEGIIGGYASRREALACITGQEVDDKTTLPSEDWHHSDFMASAPASALEALKRFCLDPECEALRCDDLPQLRQTLLELKNRQGITARNACVPTAVSEAVYEALDFTQGGGLIYVEGVERIGKSIAAKSWCEAHLGVARYVKTPASNDDISFYRAIAKAIGVSSALSLKGCQMKERIEAVIQSSKLMLCFDDAHYLWPQSNRREALPNRLNWIINALVEHGAPVALVATPQFTIDRKIVSQKTAWRPERLSSVVTQSFQLPQRLPDRDLTAIAEAMMPEAPKEIVPKIVLCAKASARHLSAVEAITRRAKFLADRNGRAVASPVDIANAITEHMPVFEAPAGNKQRECTKVAETRQELGNVTISPGKQTRKGMSRANDREGDLSTLLGA